MSQLEVPVRLDVRDRVARVELCRPGHRNSFDLATAKRFRNVMTEACTRSDVAVVLLSGQGRAFCAGGDVHAMAQAPYPSEWVWAIADAVRAGVAQLDRCRLPVVAAVQGAAAVAGLALTLVADLVITTPPTIFAAAYSCIGLTPDGGTTWLLPRCVGRSRALEMLLEDRRLTGTEAVDWGIATRAVDGDDLAVEAARAAQQLASGASGALGRTRALVRASWQATLADHLDAEAAAIAEARQRADVFLNAVRRQWREGETPSTSG